MGHSGTKTSYLLKANLKQNRIKHVIWLVLLVGLFAAAAMEFHVLFGTQEDINAIVETLKTPAMVSLLVNFQQRSHIRPQLFSLMKCWYS